MNAYIKTTTMEYPRYIGDIQNEFPDWNELADLPEGWAKLIYLDLPITPPYFKREILPPILNLNKEWVIGWSDQISMTDLEKQFYDKRNVDQVNANLITFPVV
jgi:hypothetical protein